MNLTVNQRTEMINYMIKKNPEVTIRVYLEALEDLEKPEVISSEAPCVFPRPYVKPPEAVKLVQFRKVRKIIRAPEEPKKKPLIRPAAKYDNKTSEEKINEYLITPPLRIASGGQG